MATLEDFMTGKFPEVEDFKSEAVKRHEEKYGISPLQQRSIAKVFMKKVEIQRSKEKPKKSEANKMNIKYLQMKKKSEEESWEYKEIPLRRFKDLEAEGVTEIWYWYKQDENGYGEGYMLLRKDEDFAVIDLEHDENYYPLVNIIDVSEFDWGTFEDAKDYGERDADVRVLTNKCEKDGGIASMENPSTTKEKESSSLMYQKLKEKLTKGRA